MRKVQACSESGCALAVKLISFITLLGALSPSVAQAGKSLSRCQIAYGNPSITNLCLGPMTASVTSAGYTTSRSGGPYLLGPGQSQPYDHSAGFVSIVKLGSKFFLMPELIDNASSRKTAEGEFSFPIGALPYNEAVPMRVVRSIRGQRELDLWRQRHSADPEREGNPRVLDNLAGRIDFDRYSYIGATLELPNESKKYSFHLLIDKKTQKVVSAVFSIPHRYGTSYNQLVPLAER